MLVPEGYVRYLPAFAQISVPVAGRANSSRSGNGFSSFWKMHSFSPSLISSLYRAVVRDDFPDDPRGDSGLYPLELNWKQTNERGMKRFCVWNGRSSQQNRFSPVHFSLFSSSHTHLPVFLHPLFEQHHYFGLAPSQVVFFSQGTLPCIDNDGHVILSSPFEVRFEPRLPLRSRRRRTATAVCSWRCTAATRRSPAWSARRA